MTKKYLFFITLLFFFAVSCQTVQKVETDKSIFGTWTRINIQSKSYKEIFILLKNYTYSIKAREIENNTLAAGSFGTFSFDNAILTLKDNNRKITNEPYYLTNEGNLLILNNNKNNPWKRIK
jgi:hypothetical protein